MVVIITPQAIKIDNKFLRIDHQNPPQIIHCLGFSLKQTEQYTRQIKRIIILITIDVYSHYR